MKKPGNPTCVRSVEIRAASRAGVAASSRASLTTPGHAPSATAEMSRPTGTRLVRSAMTHALGRDWTRPVTAEARDSNEAQAATRRLTVLANAAMMFASVSAGSSCTAKQ